MKETKDIWDNEFKKFANENKAPKMKINAEILITNYSVYQSIMSKCTNKFNNNSYDADITNNDKDNYYVGAESSYSNLPNLIDKRKERASSSSLRSVCYDNSNKECNHRSSNHSNNYRNHSRNGIQKKNYHKDKQKASYNMNFITRYEFEKENQSPDSDVRMRYKQDTHVKGLRYRDLMEKAKQSCGAHMGRLKF